MVASEAAPDAAGQLLRPDSEPPARVVVNFAWSMLAQGGAALIGGAVTIYAVRTFSTATWGHYSTALALVALFTVLSGAGLGPLALRELTAAPALQGELLGALVRALALSSMAAACGLLAVTVLGYSHQVFVLVLIMTPLVGLSPALAILVSAFNARSRLEYAAWFQLAQSALYGVVALAVVANANSITGLAASNLAAALGGAGLGLVLLRRRLDVRLQLKQPLRRSLALLRAAAPIGGIALVGIVYARIDTLMISLLSNATDVARYAVPYGLVQFSWLLPSVVSAAFFPLLSRRLSDGSDEAEALFFLVMRAFLFVSVPVALVFSLAAPALLPFVFGHRYEASALVLQIMAWTSVFGFQNYILWYGMLASHQERAALLVQLVGLAANVGVNAIAIPIWGSAGAAGALVASDLVVVVGLIALIHRNLFRVPYARILGKPLAVGAIVVPAAIALAVWNAICGALIGAAFYAVALLALDYVSSEEWEPLVALVRRTGSLIRRDSTG